MLSYNQFLSEAVHKPGPKGVPPMVRTGQIRKFVKKSFNDSIRANGYFNREDHRQKYHETFPDYDDVFFDQYADDFESKHRRNQHLKSFAAQNANAAGRGAYYGAKIGGGVGQIAGFAAGATAGVVTNLIGNLAVNGYRAGAAGIKAIASKVDRDRSDSGYYTQHRMNNYPPGGYSKTIDH